MIPEYLQRHGCATAERLYELFAKECRFRSFDECREYLKCLENKGYIRRSTAEVPKYHYDQDFTCNACGESWPTVIRRHGSAICKDCRRAYNQKYREDPDSARTGRKDERPQTVLNEPEPGWDAKSSQKYLSMKMG